MALAPVVSVVVPSHLRPLLLTRAVRSALGQSFSALEVVVVVDGRDPDTVQVLAEIADPRVRFVEVPAPVGGAEARNVGAAEARGEWVAFLDDDDEWMPQKLARQLQIAQACSEQYPIVASRLIARSPRGDYIWPRRLPRPGEPVSEYLFVRRSLFQGEGLIQTSMIFTRRSLLLKVPFTRDLRGHQEWDWLLRAGRVHGAVIVFAPDPLLIWHIEEERPSTSRNGDWRESLRWIRENRDLVTPRAYAAFLTTVVSARAARAGAVGQGWSLLVEAARRGNLRPADVAFHFGMWIVPRGLRRSLRRLLHGRRPA